MSIDIVHPANLYIYIHGQNVYIFTNLQLLKTKRPHLINHIHMKRPKLLPECPLRIELQNFSTIGGSSGSDGKITGQQVSGQLVLVNAKNFCATLIRTYVKLTSTTC